MVSGPTKIQFFHSFRHGEVGSIYPALQAPMGSFIGKWLSTLLTACSKTFWRPVESLTMHKKPYPPTVCDLFCLPPSTRLKGQCYTSFLKLKMGNVIYNYNILDCFYHVQCSYSKLFNCVAPLCPSQQAHNTY